MAALGVHLEGAVARCSQWCHRAWSLQKAVAVDGHVQAVVGLLQAALLKLRLVDTVRTPRPRCSPVGSWFCSVAAAPTWR